MSTRFEADFIAALTPAKARECSLAVEEMLSETNQQYAETEMSQFRDELKAMDDASVLHLDRRFKDITEKIIQIRKDKPDEKMIVAAHTDKDLDMISEMLERQLRKNEVLRCSVGRIDKMTLDPWLGGYDQWDSFIQRLNDPSDDLGIILLSALDYRWWGFNLQRASTMFLSDAVWSHARHQRLLGTIQRLGQTRPCTVYDCAMSNEMAKAVREKSQI